MTKLFPFLDLIKTCIFENLKNYMALGPSYKLPNNYMPFCPSYKLPKIKQREGWIYLSKRPKFGG